MPTYEYQCGACQHQLEAFQKISEEPLKECPACHQQTLQRLVSAAGFQLKGSGWYVTDYSAKNKKKSESGTESGTDSSAKNTDASSNSNQSAAG